MKHATFLIVLILAALALVPATARAGDEDKATVIGCPFDLPPLIVVGERHQPRVILMLQRAPIGYKLPPLTHETIPDVAASVNEIDTD